MRILEQAGIPFETLEYEVDESDLSGVHAAEILNINPECMFKTLVTRGEKNGIQIFVIPVAEELDFKKCALASKDKRVEMIHLKEILAVTGYIRGGCSPVGMKKKYPTFIDETAILFDKIFLSGGKRGCQIIVNPETLAKFIDAEFFDLTKD